MAESRSNIQVPPRQDDEAPASAEQLQFIRQLVTGMSLQGFRFDYRKLGTAQAAAIIDQLLALRDADGKSAPSGGKGGGCVNAFARGVVTIGVVAVVFAGIAGGGYLIWNKINESPTGDRSQSASDNTADGTDPSDSGSTRQSTIFHGLTAEDDRSQTNDNESSDTPQPPGPIETEPTPNTPTPPTVGTLDRTTARQLDQLQLLLAQLSQFTRKEYDVSIRAQSSAGMAKKLDELSALMAQLDPALAQRVRQVIAGYGAQAIDGQAIRAEIKSIREQLAAPGQ